LADRAHPARGEDAWGRTPKPAGWLSAEGLSPTGEGQLKGAGREDLAKRLATHRYCRPALELHTPRFRGERGQDSRWYRHQREGLPLAPSPAQGRSHWGWLRLSRGGGGQRGATRRQPPRRPPSPDPGRVPGPLQLMWPGDHPMQKLALMMAVMMLGNRSPVNGCNTSVDSGSQGVGGQAEMMFPPSAGIP
jgi:hypothetical protein